jgi:hypothetical protein
LIYNEAVNSTYTWKNNLFYNSSGLGYTLNIFANGIRGSGTNDNTHNTYLNSGSPGGGTGTVAVISGAPNPYVDWPNSNFHLVSANTFWENGINLSSPYNVDMEGKPRPSADGIWNRGAFQNTGVQPQRPAPPSNLITTVQ